MLTLLKNINAKSQQVFRLILLYVTYVFGIGTSSILGRLLGKHFLGEPPGKTAWKKSDNNHNPEHMF